MAYRQRAEEAAIFAISEEAAIFAIVIRAILSDVDPGGFGQSYIYGLTEIDLSEPWALT